MAEKPMTKTEVRAFIRRAREGLRWMETALADGDASDFNEACIEAGGSIAHVQDAVSEYGSGIRGVS